MDKLKYFKVIDLIDEDIIEEAEIKTTAATDNDGGRDITVSGTERYRSISWHRLAAVASALLLIAGIGAGGALMMRNRPPVLVESVETTAEDTTDNTGMKAGGKAGENSSSETTIRVSDKTTSAEAKTSETAQKKTKESNDISEPEEAEIDDTEEPTAEPREEKENKVTTAAQTVQPRRTTTTKAQAPTNPPKVTTAVKVLPPPDHFTTEPVTERTTPEHDPGYIPYLSWYPEDGNWLLTTLSGLSYTPWSYDVTVGGRPPEGYINGSDGNAYALCFSERWVRRNWCEQAYMPDEIYNYFGGSRYANYPLY